MLLTLRAIVLLEEQEKKGVLVFMEILVLINMFVKIGIIDLRLQRRMDGRDFDGFLIKF
jgi:hypothetical protein